LATALLAAGDLQCAAEAHGFLEGQSAPSVTQARNALQSGEADKALALLKTMSQSGSGQAEAANIECRVRLTLVQWEAAITQCQRAVQLDGQNSSYHLWLGRALGEKADRASFLNAFSLAKRVRSEFEEAVRLDPRNADALADLGEFYEEAPGVVGGGIDKATTIAGQLDKVDPARAHELRAKIAEQGKDYDSAERELKLSITTGLHPAPHFADLAAFYKHRQRWTEMETAIHGAEAAADRDRTSAVALFDGASLLMETHRDPSLAAKMFDDYLGGPGKSEEAPAFVAYLRLARLKDQLGDTAAANQDRAAAHALATEYKPGEDGKH